MTHNKEVAYLSGAISSDPHYRDKFANAQMVLEFLGYRVINPCILPEGLHYDEYMRIDLLLVEIADTLVTLPDWKHSDGATVEHDRATKLGKRIIPYNGIKTATPLADKEHWKDFFKTS